MLDGPQAPLHLQKYLVDCPTVLADALRKAVCHPLSVIHAVRCNCEQSSARWPAQGFNPNDKAAPRPASSRRMAASVNVPALLAGHDGAKGCCFFALQMNDEEGIVHAHCRRCQKKIVIYDRALYWGTPRKAEASTDTFPYKCSCGGHAFEVALGLMYPDDALDENDVDTLSVAVSCASCGEVAVVFDDEAT